MKASLQISDAPVHKSTYKGLPLSNSCAMFYLLTYLLWILPLNYLLLKTFQKIFILTTQSLSFYRPSSVDLGSSSTIEALDSCSLLVDRFSYCCDPPPQHERVFTSSPALLNWLVSCTSCVCLIWCSNFYFFTNTAQNSFSYVFKGRQSKSSIILESDPCVTTAMIQVLHTFNMVMTAASFCFQCPPL